MNRHVNIYCANSSGSKRQVVDFIQYTSLYDKCLSYKKKKVGEAYTSKTRFTTQTRRGKVGSPIYIDDRP